MVFRLLLMVPLLLVLGLGLEAVWALAYQAGKVAQIMERKMGEKNLGQDRNGRCLRSVVTQAEVNERDERKQEAVYNVIYRKEQVC